MVSYHPETLKKDFGLRDFNIIIDTLKNFSDHNIIFFKPNFDPKNNLIASSIKKAQKNKKGIIFLTPHLGCYEITSIYYGSKYPLTVMYRPPRQKWLINLIKQGREKGFLTLAPTDKSGVRKILKALRNNESVGILPDQAANKGEGEWANFFGRPAFTMVLVSKLVKKTGANVVMTFGERLPNGKGFNIHFKAIDSDKVSTPSKLNKTLGDEIRKAPTQYLWNYDKHKGLETQIKKKSISTLNVHKKIKR